VAPQQHRFRSGAGRVSYFKAAFGLPNERNHIDSHTTRSIEHSSGHDSGGCEALLSQSLLCDSFGGLDPTLEDNPEVTKVALTNASTKAFKSISSLRSIENLRLVNLGEFNGHLGIRQPLSAALPSLRYLSLSHCRIIRPALEQLINQSPNLEQVSWDFIHYEEEEDEQAEPCLHIRSSSLKQLAASGNKFEPVGHMELDAPSLKSLDLNYGDACAVLRTPSLLRLRMNTVNQLGGTSLDHLKELTFWRHNNSFDASFPDVLRRTPNLVKLTIIPWCDKGIRLMGLDAFFSGVPSSVTALELSGQFLGALTMPAKPLVVNKSILEIGVTESKTRSMVMGNLANLKLLRTACPELQKLSLELACSKRSISKIRSMFEDVPCLSVESLVIGMGTSWDR
jgi:hypothetical protein